MKKTILAGICALALVFCGCAYQPYHYDLTTKITLGDYRSVRVTVETPEIGDAQLQSAVGAILKDHGYGESITLTEGVLQMGDTVLFAYDGYIDGQKDDALSGDSMRVTIGSGEYLEDLEMGLIGQPIGKPCTLQVSFPEDYMKVAYAGRTAEYHVTVRSAERMQYPALTDEIVSRVSDFSDVDSFLADTLKTAREQALIEAEETAETKAWRQIVDSSTVIEYPAREIKILEERCRAQFEQSAQEADMTLSEYLADSNLTEAEYEDYVAAYAKRYCKDEMVMYAIARAEGITASDEEIEALAEQYADHYGYKSVRALYKSYDRYLVEQAILYQKVTDLVIESALGV